MLEFKYHTYQNKKITEIESNSLYDALFELSTDAFFVLDATDLSIVDCNSAGIKLFEAKSKNLLLGLPSFRLYNYEPSQISSDSFSNDLNITGEYTQEMSFRTLRQNVFWGRLTRKPVRDNNGEFILLKIQKAANYLKDEEALSNLLNGTAKVTGTQFFSTLTKLLCRTFSSNFAFVAKMNSAQKEMEFVHFCSEEKITLSNVPVENSIFENVVRGYTSFYPNNVQELFPEDKTVKKLNVKSFLGAPIFDSTGRSIGVLGVMHSEAMEEIPNSRYLLSIFASRSAAEIQRMKSKEMLREQTRELAYANHMKDRLLSVLSNDLKAPLHTILSYSDIIGERMHSYSAKQLTDKFEILDNSVRSLYSILENVTDWSKIQSDELIVKQEKVSLYSLIATNYSILEPLASIKALTFINDVDEEKTVMADTHMIDSIIRNLLTMAVKYSTKNGTIKFSFKSNKDKTVLIFEDSCANFEEEELMKYWNITDTIPEFMSAEQNQHALGIFLIREYTHRMGYKISYVFNKERGYTYTIEMR